MNQASAFGRVVKALCLGTPKGNPKPAVGNRVSSNLTAHIVLFTFTVSVDIPFLFVRGQTTGTRSTGSYCVWSLFHYMTAYEFVL
jgi:hypothetical protein